MADSVDYFGPQRPPRLPPRPPPLPVVSVGALNYYRHVPSLDLADWAVLKRFHTTAQWHQARAALARGHIESLMGEGEDVQTWPDADDSVGIELLVPKTEVARANLILQAVAAGADWCPRCGSMELTKLRLPWWWVFWSILFLGVAPFSPPRFECRHCWNRWE